ncbi:hypothetical protein [Nioella nitratireducens]
MTGLTNVNLPGLLLDALIGIAPKNPAQVERNVVAGKREVFWNVVP